jgi:hypothetical protein
MSINFDEIHLTKRQILERISEQSIYEYYLNDRIKTGTLLKCCFHKDHSPSLGFYKSSGGEMIFKCFGCGAQGNVFKFVSDLHNGIDFGKTLNLIQRTFNLSKNGHNSPIVCPTISSSTFNEDETDKKTLILPTHRNFNKIDYDFWNQFYIPLPLLLTYDVRACERVYIVKKSGEYVLFAEHTKFNPIYSYQINENYKIYRPYSDKKGKWASNTDVFDVQGLKQLPAKGELLIITSSLKDVMVLNVMGYNAIALGGEGMRLPEKILDYLWACFDNIVVFYDNDAPGLKYGEALANEIGAGNIYIPVEEPKDISDYVKKHNFEKGIDLMKQLL